MKIQDNRGVNKKNEGCLNLERVKDWYIRNPSGLQRECARDLELDTKTVSKYVQILRKG